MASTVDPLGGSWFVEALTNRVERDVWRYLDEIDRRGGMVAAIAEGYPQREIADAAYRFQREFDEGERVIVGVNGYVNDEPVTVPVLAGARGVAGAAPGPPGSGRGRSATARRSAAALEGLREAASRPGSSETNLMPHFLRCAEALRDPRRAVPRAARGLRGVPGAGLGLTAGAALRCRHVSRCPLLPRRRARRLPRLRGARRPDRRAARQPGRGRRRLVRPRPHGPHHPVAGGGADDGEGARGQRDEPDQGLARRRVGQARGRGPDERGRPRPLPRAADRRGPAAVPRDGRASCAAT